MNAEVIKALFDEWNLALQSGDAQKVAALYDEKSTVLLPTLSSRNCYNQAEVEKYFVEFLTQEPRGEISECNVRIFDDIAINSGMYSFTLNNNNNLKARFTFVYRWNGKRWLIIEHHSSAMPE